MVHACTSVEISRNYNVFILQVESYDVDDLIKKKFPPMKKGRSSFTPISIGKYIYVFGGYMKIKAIDACER